MAKAAIHLAAHYVESNFSGKIVSDKVWGIAKVGTTFVRFWGRRGGALKFKTEVNGIPDHLYRAKLDKGYRSMSVGLLDLLLPEIEEKMPSQYYSALARGKVNTNH